MRCVSAQAITPATSVPSTALLGDLVGAFADASASFTYFDSSIERLRHAVGTYLLTASGLVFMTFAASNPLRARSGRWSSGFYDPVRNSSATSSPRLPTPALAKMWRRCSCAV